jgi:hypothetical protein
MSAHLPRLQRHAQLQQLPQHIASAVCTLVGCMGHGRQPRLKLVHTRALGRQLPCIRQQLVVAHTDLQ